MITFSIKNIITISLLCASCALLPSDKKDPKKEMDHQKEQEGADAKHAQEAKVEPTAQDKATLLAIQPVLDALTRVLRQLERNTYLTQQEYNALRKDAFRQCDLAGAVCQKFSEPFKQKVDGAFQPVINAIDAAKQNIARIDAERKHRLLKAALESDEASTLHFAAIAFDDTPEDNYPHLQYKPAPQEAAPDDFSRALVHGGEHAKALLERFEKNAHEMNKQDHEGWTPGLQLATHGHTQLLQDGLRVMNAKWYAAQKAACADFNEKAETEFLTLVTFDAPVPPTLACAQAGAAQQASPVKRIRAFSSSEFHLVCDHDAGVVCGDEDATQHAVAAPAASAAQCPPAHPSKTQMAGGSAGGNAAAAAAAACAARMPAQSAQPVKASAAAAAGQKENALLRTRHYFVNSKRLRPFLCRSVLLPKEDMAKVVARIKAQRPTAVMFTGHEAYLFTKHLDVRARTYPNISVIDDEATQQRFQKAHAEYQDRLQAAVHGALDVPQQPQALSLEDFFALEKPTRGIPVQPVRSLICAYLETDFPHEVQFARPGDVVSKKKDRKCVIQ